MKKEDHPWWQRSKEMLSAIKSVQENLEKVPAYMPTSDYDYSWKLKTKKFPYSCTDEEGLMIYFTIVENQLKSGFEIATAFGYSSAYIGMAMNKTGGKCISLDCYVEESEEDFLYNEAKMKQNAQRIREEISQGKLPIGLAFAKDCIQKLGLHKIIEFKVGVSPEDVPAAINNRAIDFAFIDGGHFGEQPTKDFLAIAPNLAERCAILFHDNHNKYVRRAVQEAESALKSRAVQIRTRNTLTLVGRGLSSEFVKLFRLFPASREVAFSDRLRFFLWEMRQEIKRELRKHPSLYGALERKGIIKP